jgi:orotidine-5'-phosphate decarboxylase
MMPSVQPRDRLIVALDRSRRDELLGLADRLDGAVGLFKLGLQSFLANGPAIVRDFVDAKRSVFLDLKLHDIPHTVAKATAEAAGLGAGMLTLHAAGGRAMLQAASRAREGSGLLLLGVSVLTSLGERDLREIGFEGGAEQAVRRLAVLARDCGLDGVVASPLEIATIRGACGPEFLIVTPGIRAGRDDAGDQARTLSATRAIEAGADYIVVGRPITEAPDPREAAIALFAQDS